MGFDSRTRRHVRTEFVVVLSPSGFPPGTSVFSSDLPKSNHFQIPTRFGIQGRCFKNKVDLFISRSLAAERQNLLHRVATHNRNNF